MTFDEQRVSLPPHFRTEETAGGLRISWHLPRYLAVIVIVFAVFWDAMLLFFIGRFNDDGPPKWFMIFLIVHFAAGVLLPYAALVIFVNHSVLEVGRGMLRVRQRPLPWYGNRALRTTEIARLFTAQKESSKGNVSYVVMARLTSGREVSVVPDLDETQAKFLEHTITRRLGLPTDSTD